jgi:hypothetical protein
VDLTPKTKLQSYYEHDYESPARPARFTARGTSPKVAAGKNANRIQD